MKNYGINVANKSFENWQNSYSLKTTEPIRATYLSQDCRTRNIFKTNHKSLYNFL